MSSSSMRDRGCSSREIQLRRVLARVRFRSALGGTRQTRINLSSAAERFENSKSLETIRWKRLNDSTTACAHADRSYGLVGKRFDLMGGDNDRRVLIEKLINPAKDFFTNRTIHGFKGFIE